MLVALVGQQDDLKAVAVLAVSRAAEFRLHLLGLSFGEPDVDHDGLLPLDVSSPPPMLGRDTFTGYVYEGVRAFRLKREKK
jgi:hypothetical protein